MKNEVIINAIKIIMNEKHNWIKEVKELLNNDGISDIIGLYNDYKKHKIKRSELYDSIININQSCAKRLNNNTININQDINKIIGVISEAKRYNCDEPDNKATEKLVADICSQIYTLIVLSVLLNIDVDGAMTEYLDAMESRKIAKIDYKKYLKF